MSYNINNPPVDNPPGLVIQQDKQEVGIEATIPSTEEALQEFADALQAAVDAKAEKDEEKEEKEAISAVVNKPQIKRGG